MSEIGVKACILFERPHTAAEFTQWLNQSLCSPVTGPQQHSINVINVTKELKAGKQFMKKIKNVHKR